MKRFLTLTIMAGLFFYACNKKNGNDVALVHYACTNNDPLPSISGQYDALHDTLDSLNTLLFQKLKAGEVALRETAAQSKSKSASSVEARTSLWPLYAN